MSRDSGTLFCTSGCRANPEVEGPTKALVADCWFAVELHCRYTHLALRKDATVGALRAKARHVDLAPLGVGGTKPNKSGSILSTADVYDMYRRGTRVSASLWDIFEAP